MKAMNIPVGVSDFAEIRQNGYYYVDKSGLISALLQTAATKVILITRPRRFGKIAWYEYTGKLFDIRKDSRKLFDGLRFQNTRNCAASDEPVPTRLFPFVRWTG